MVNLEESKRTVAFSSGGPWPQRSREGSAVQNGLLYWLQCISCVLGPKPGGRHVDGPFVTVVEIIML